MASSRDGVELFLALTQGERNALKAVASGMVGTVSILQLGKLRSLNLIHHDGRNIALTTDGRGVVDLVDRTPLPTLPIGKRSNDKVS